MMLPIFVSNRFKMEANLENLLTQKPDHFAGTVVIRGWSKREWKDGHTLGMLRVCSLYDIRKIKMLGGDENQSFLKLLKNVKTPRVSFLSHLHTIEVESGNYPPAIEVGKIMQVSRVAKITWKFLKIKDSLHFVSECKRILKTLEHFNLFESVSNLREFKFMVLRDETGGVFMPFKLDAIDTGMLGAHLKRNQRAFEKCQKVIITLLGLKKQKGGHLFHLVDRNVLKIVVNMVWETRGTAVWTK